MRGQYIIGPTMFGNQSWGLSALQQKICIDAQQSIKTPSKQMEEVMLGYHWKEYLSIITNEAVPIHIKIVCISAAKNLVYNKKFVQNPEDFFNSFLTLYLSNQTVQPTKIQQLMQNIFRAVSQTFFTEKISQNCCKLLIQHLHENPHHGIKVSNILELLVENMQPQTINNQEIVGQIFLYFQELLPSPKIVFLDKAKIMTCLIKLCEKIVDFASLQQQDDNIPQIHLRNSEKTKLILQQIISQNQQGQHQILSENAIINKLKFAAISLHSVIWIYNLDQRMFPLFINTLIHRPDNLIDQQIQIMEKVVVMLERSVCQEEYEKVLHANAQMVSISLLKLMAPSLSYMDLLDTDPQQFVQILEDFAMEQHNQMLLTKAGSLLSCLCMYVDGYLSFIGSMLIMILKRYDGSAQQLINTPEMSNYFQNIDTMFNVPQQIQASISALMLCCLSDQIQKRTDLYRPTITQIHSMNNIFKIEQCPVPPYLICRFMLLTSFYPFQGCMDVFLPYKYVKPVYDCQLQSCYRVLTRYSNKKGDKLRQYIKNIEPIMILSHTLTPTLEAAIINERNDLPLAVQFMILEKLVIWMEDAISSLNMPKCNKVCSLITSLIDRMAPQPQKQKDCEQGLFGYLRQLYCIQLGQKSHPGQQFLVDIATTHIKHFPILQHIQERLPLFVNISCQIIQKNNYIMNNCMELLGAIINISSHQMIYSLAELLMKWLPIQQRQQQRWQYFYLLELCVLRVGKLNMNMKLFPINIQMVDSILNQTKDKILATRIMMFLYSISFVGGGEQNSYIFQYLNSKLVPQFIPPYENKPFCLYLIHLLATLNCNLQYTQYLLNHIFLCIKRQQKLQVEMKKYEQNVYNIEDQTSEVAINAFTRTRYTKHPLHDDKFQFYTPFQQVWGKITFKQQILDRMELQGKQFLQTLLLRKMVNRKTRQIVRVKRMLPNPSHSEKDSQQMKQ